MNNVGVSGHGPVHGFGIGDVSADDLEVPYCLASDSCFTGITGQYQNGQPGLGQSLGQQVEQNIAGETAGAGDQQLHHTQVSSAVYPKVR
jgi:hypothetical protein